MKGAAATPSYYKEMEMEGEQRDLKSQEDLCERKVGLLLLMRWEKAWLVYL